jgi:endoglycosylceramidase
MRPFTLVALLFVSLSISETADSGTFHSDSPFIRDARGRVVFFHGVNAVWKVKSPTAYYPPSSIYPAPFNADPSGSYFDDRDGTFLAENGLNVVRLGVLFVGVEPRRGQFDERYLDRIENLVDMLAGHGVSVLLDFHQDMYNEKYQGEGFPDWAVIDDGLPPQNPTFGFPLNYFTPPVMRAFDNLWANRWGLARQYRKAWAHVAARFASKTNVLGYDLFNEPWPGSQWPTCANPAGCPVFDSLVMQPFYERVMRGIRDAESDAIIWWAPNSINNFGPVNGVGLIRPIDDPGENQGLAFHAYCLIGGAVPGVSQGADPICPTMEQLAFQRQGEAAARNGSAKLLTEFGASDDSVDLGRVTALADENLTSWIYWQYANWSDPTGNPGGESLFTNDLDRPGSLKQAKADLLVRTYPQAVAGTPRSFSFDPLTNIFTLSYAADGAITAPTVIFVPVARHYGAGYAVTVTGSAHQTSAAGAPSLTLANDGSGAVTVTVAPTGP